MRDAGVVLKTARQRIGARAGTDEECLLLDEPPNSPMLTMDRVTQDGDGRVVEYASHLFRASRYEYAATLVGRP
jgi:DNA-binding GntR family transcriptional regulator